MFVLTCHPEIVRLAIEAADVDGYWCLDDGQFDGPRDDRRAAIKFLNVG